MAHGEYPERLEALVPALLKRVPIDLPAQKDTPLKYRREADGGFVLYSVGLNREDDQGNPGTPRYVPPLPKPYEGRFPRLEEGDWVWRQPGRQESGGR